MIVYKVERNIVIPDKYAQNASGFVAPFRQVHLYSTSNSSATLDNEVAYLSSNCPNGNYTHLVGESWRVIQVADVDQGAFGVATDYVKLSNPSLNMALRQILLLLQKMFDMFLLLYSK